MRLLLPREEIQARLLRIFPREAFDAVLSNPLAAAALAAMLYVDAVVADDGPLPDDATWVRPSLCLWMSDEVYRHDSDSERAAWCRAALRSRSGVEGVEADWRERDVHRWYADNSRETLRDETFPRWLDHGALRQRPGVTTNSSAPRWALTASFAELFDPTLDADVLGASIEAWRQTRMSPGDRLRIATLRRRDHAAHAVDVTLPDGTVRNLEPGDASRILQGVLQLWAPARLVDPVVVSISEPGDKVYLADQSRLRSLGITVDAGNLLPDAVIVDIGSRPPAFWIVEAVASDGVVTESRRRQLLRWAEDQGIPPASCRFLTAFLDRHASVARRRLKDLATDTFAWFLGEPTRELAWYEIGEPGGEPSAWPPGG